MFVLGPATKLLKFELWVSSKLMIGIGSFAIEAGFVVNV